jgi:Uma2 family endonuclease
MTVAKDHPNAQPLLINISNTALHSIEQLELLRNGNPDLKLELTEEGKLSVMSPEIRGNGTEKTLTAMTEVSPPEDEPISHPTSSGQYSLVKLTAEETARRVGMVERRIERERQEWDSLTPAQKAEHDRQFDELYKSLAESRK